MVADDIPDGVGNLHGEAKISITEDLSRDQLEGELHARGIESNVIFRAASFEMMRGMVSGLP